ncbi:forkhead box protein J3-like protein, partial [Dissophora ornata]
MVGQSLSPAEYDEQSKGGCSLPGASSASSAPHHASFPAEPQASTENVSKFFSETGHKTNEAVPAQRRSTSHKPALSYAELISQVLLESNKIKMTLAEIYASIMHNHPYYRHAASGWQASCFNSIRHCLSLNTAFLKVDRTVDEPGKGCFWALRKD